MISFSVVLLCLSPLIVDSRLQLTGLDAPQEEARAPAKIASRSAHDPRIVTGTFRSVVA